MSKKRWTLHDKTQEKKKHFDGKEAAQDSKAFLVSEGHDVELIDNFKDGDEMDVEVVDMTDGGEPRGDPGTPAAQQADPKQASETTNDGPTLQEDPIGYLKNINPEFVNKVKGNDAISKRGFRYIQAELDITTESKVAGWSDDPYGVVVWARAELPDGRAAEAHGEGYPGERGMDKGEWVRYADTRAKNRALSDLTSAGALAVDELRGGFDE